MANWRLSYVKDTNSMIQDAKAGINEYIDVTKEKINGLADENPYYSQVFRGSLVYCILTFLIGAGLIVVEVLGLAKKYIDAFNDDVMGEYNLRIPEYILYVIGVLLVIIAIHGFCRVLYGNMFKRATPAIDKARTEVLDVLSKQIPNVPIAELINKRQDYNAEEHYEADTRFSGLFASINSKNRFTKLVTLASRIAIPVFLACYVASLLWSIKTNASGTLYVFYLVLSFVVMFFLCRRIRLLSEYAKKLPLPLLRAVKAAMCIPAVAYAVSLYFVLNKHFDGARFLDDSLVNGWPEALGFMLSIPFLLALLQGVVLLYATITMDYWRERQAFAEGLYVRRTEETIEQQDYNNPVKRLLTPGADKGTYYNKYDLYIRTVIHCILMSALVILIVLLGILIDRADSNICYGFTVIFGLLWGLFSNMFWCRKKRRTLLELWGTHYTFAVEMFFAVLIPTILFPIGIVLAANSAKYSAIFLATVILTIGIFRARSK